MRLFSFSAKTGSAALLVAGVAALYSAPAFATEYSCDAGRYSFTTTPVSSQKIRLADSAGNKATLRRKRSASGEIFAGQDRDGTRFELSTKGREAMLMVDGRYSHKECVAKAADTTSNGPETPTAYNTYNYMCDSGSYSFSLLQTRPKRYYLTDGAGNKVSLREVPAGSGMRLMGKDSDGDVYEVSLKGNEGLVQVGDNMHKDCKTE